MENNDKEYQGKLKYSQALDEIMNEYYYYGGNGIFGGNVAKRSSNVGPVDHGGQGRVKVIQPAYDPVDNEDLIEDEDECEVCDESPCVCEKDVCEKCGKEDCECN